MLDFNLFGLSSSNGKKGESKFNYADSKFCEFAGIKTDEISSFESKYLRKLMRRYITSICMKYGVKIATKTFNKTDANNFEQTICNCLTSKQLQDVGEFEIVGAGKRVLGTANNVVTEILKVLKTAK